MIQKSKRSSCVTAATDMMAHNMVPTENPGDLSNAIQSQ